MKCSVNTLSFYFLNIHTKIPDPTIKYIVRSRLRKVKLSGCCLAVIFKILIWTSLSSFCILWRLSHINNKKCIDIKACISSLQYIIFPHPQSFVSILYEESLTKSLIQNLAPRLKFSWMNKFLTLFLCWSWGKIEKRWRDEKKAGNPTGYEWSLHNPLDLMMCIPESWRYSLMKFPSCSPWYLKGYGSQLMFHTTGKTEPIFKKRRKNNPGNC